MQKYILTAFVFFYKSGKLAWIGVIFAEEKSGWAKNTFPKIRISWTS